ncbi:MAG: hypothetical protein WD075_06245 [Rhodospirillales bacterium]
MTLAQYPKCRAAAIMGVLLVVALGTAGCLPLVTIAGAALGGIGGGSSGSAPAASGAFGLGTPSLAQNANTKSPVQNIKPTEQVVHDVLNHADNQSVRESCLESLPPEAKLPVSECTTRLTCIPGLSRPLMMRTCPADMTVAQTGEQGHAMSHAPDAGTAWQWDDTSKM